MSSVLALEERPRRSALRRWLVRAAGVVAFGLLLGPMLALILPGSSMYRVTVFTLCVSVASWAFVDGLRALAARGLQRQGRHAANGWPGWGWMSAAIVIGTFAGYSTGSAVAGWWLDMPTPGLFTRNPGQTVPSIVISAIAAIGISYWFWSRGRIAATEARAQKAQREATETQLRLLQSQLEPHMLFNTLANLRVLIGLDPARAEAMLDALIAFLRATLEASRAGAHPLAAEFERCADYLALMQVRMGARLRSTIELPPALAPLPVPPLVLQPLVENAIRHGLEPKVEGGRITLRATREGDLLLLSVIDDGIGLRDAGGGGGTRFGLQQVRDRLATLYGERASLHLAGTDSGGVAATIRLPIAGSA